MNFKVMASVVGITIILAVAGALVYQSMTPKINKNYVDPAQQQVLNTNTMVKNVKTTNREGLAEYADADDEMRFLLAKEAFQIDSQHPSQRGEPSLDQQFSNSMGFKKVQTLSLETARQQSAELPANQTCAYHVASFGERPKGSLTELAA